MKMNKKLLVLSAIFAVAAQFGTAATAADVNGTATALVIEPLSIIENSALDFGTVAGGPSLDAIVMTAGGVRTVTGTSARIIPVGPGAAGNFTITGEPNQAYVLSISASATLGNGAGDSMTVDTFTDNAPSPLDAGGSDTLLVGGTLRIGANQAGGTYSTTTGGAPYLVTVNYN
jgi:hypothetical protein